MTIRLMTPFDQTRSLGHLTGLAGRLFNTLLTRRFAAAGIDMTAEQWGVVVLLLNHHTMTQRELVEALYLDKSSVSRSIKGMEKRGWVISRPGEDDARQRWVSLSPEAQSVAERCAEIANSVLRDAQQGITDADLSDSLDGLSAVITNLRNLNQA